VFCDIISIDKIQQVNRQTDITHEKEDFGTWSNPGQNIIDRRGFLGLLMGGAAMTAIAFVNPTSEAQQNTPEANPPRLSPNQLFNATLMDTYNPEVRSILNQIEYSILTKDYSNFSSWESKVNAISIMSAMFVNTFGITNPEEISYYRSMANRVTFYQEGEQPCGDNAGSCASYDRTDGSIPLPDYDNWLVIFSHELVHQIAQSYAVENVQIPNNPIVINGSYIKQFDTNLQSIIVAGVCLNTDASDIIIDTSRVASLEEVNADILSGILIQRITRGQSRDFGKYINGYSTRDNIPNYYKESIRHIAGDSEGLITIRHALYQSVKSHNSLAIGQVLANTAISRLEISPDDVTNNSLGRRRNATGGISSFNTTNATLAQLNLIDQLKLGTWIMAELGENADYFSALVRGTSSNRSIPEIHLLGDKNLIIERLRNNQDISDLIEVVWGAQEG
jgi:hypothetical protein